MIYYIIIVYTNIAIIYSDYYGNELQSKDKNPQIIAFKSEPALLVHPQTCWAAGVFL